MINFNRKSLRLPHYDYSQTGAYFITIVTQKRASLFGSIHDEEMVLNDAGEMIDRVCYELPQFIPNVLLEPYVIMPNHFHAIVIIGEESVGADLRVCPQNCDLPLEGRPQRVAPTKKCVNEIHPISLSDVVGRFKSLTTRRYITGVKKLNWPRFENRLWQRNYYEHVIRDDKDFQRYIDYILCNPQNWEKDEEYIKNIGF